MAMLALGPFAFEALGFSYTERQRVLETGWADIDVAGGPTRMQWMGGKGSREVIKGVLFSEFGGGGSLAGISLAASSGISLPLVSLGGAPTNIFGMHAIEKVAEDHAYIDASGRWRKNAYSIELRAVPGSPSIVQAASTFIQALFS